MTSLNTTMAVPAPQKDTVLPGKDSVCSRTKPMPSSIVNRERANILRKAFDASLYQDTRTVPGDQLRTRSVGPFQKLFSTRTNVGKFIYPREYEYDPGVGESQNNQPRKLTSDGGETTAVIMVSGIPDGIHPRVNEALIEADARLRLVYYSDVELNDTELDSLDSFYGTKSYPILRLAPEDAIARVDDPLRQYPRCNFFETNDALPATNSHYREYRYVQYRHISSKIVLALESGYIFRLAPLPVEPPLILIMPFNFQQVTPRSGYFLYLPYNIIVRVYSGHLLTSAEHYSEDFRFVTSFEDREAQLLPIVQRLFSWFGLHRIVVDKTQICGFDDECLLMFVVGSIANLSPPIAN